MPDHIASIRAFNRDYTRIIGLLNERMLESRFVLAEARVIHEIGKREPVTAAEIADELAMDRGQLSRLVKRLVKQGIIASERSGHDGRATLLELTETGQTACAGLNAMSDRAIADLIAPLDTRQRDRLVEAMTSVSGLVMNSSKKPAMIGFRRHRLGELGWLIQRQALLYNSEFGWNSEFEALIARIYAEYEQAAETPPKRLWVAEGDGRVAGSIFVLPNAEDPSVAQLRMLYVEPWARGHGLGDRLVSEVVTFARQSGYRQAMLWTQDCLAAARKIYQRAGFKLQSEQRHRSFGKDLNGQYWTLDLDRGS